MVIARYHAHVISNELTNFAGECSSAHWPKLKLQI